MLHLGRHVLTGEQGIYTVIQRAVYVCGEVLREIAYYVGHQVVVQTVEHVAYHRVGVLCQE